MFWFLTGEDPDDEEKEDDEEEKEEKEEEDEEEKEDKVRQRKQEEHKSRKRKRRHHTSCLVAGPWADHEESKWNPMECVKRVMLNCTALAYTLHCIAVHKTKYCS